MKERPILLSAPSESGNLFIDYLRAIDEADSYKAVCTCYRCENIRRGFSAWKSERERPRPVI